KMKKAVNISCEDRVKQYPKGVLHADAGQLFCSCCNVTLDNSRKNTIDKHLLSLNHVKKRKFQQDEEAIKAKKQATSRDVGNVAHFELVEAFSSANIPLNKLDHPKLREHLQTNIKNIGQLPHSASLRKDYLPKVFDLNQEELKMRVKA
ncbi:AAEL012319-PA, partial [Aedes aegypti]